MLVELAERLGPSIDYWLEEPFAFAFWCWHQLQEHDRIRAWRDRANRLSAAELQSLAQHAPQKLSDERQALYSAARSRPSDPDAETTRGKSLARRINRALSRLTGG